MPRYTVQDAIEASFDASTADDVPPWAIEQWDEPDPIDLERILERDGR